MLNTEMYALLNPDLRRAGLTTPEKLIQHYNRRGKREHRPTNFQQKFPFFDHKQYQQNYPDLRGMNRFELEMHWLKYGIKQNRTYRDVNHLVDRFGNKKKSDTNTHIQVFTQIYEKGVWGKGEHEDFKGSPGESSRLDYSLSSFIQFMRSLIELNKIKTIVDVGCGNFDWTRPVYEDLFHLEYTGYDAYKDLIEHNKKNHPDFDFVHLDCFNQKEKMKTADLCIVKDVFQHWSNKDIRTFLDYLVIHKRYKYILIINCSRQTEDNKDISTGGYRELNSSYAPLKDYKAKRLYEYSIKEASMIFI